MMAQMWSSWCYCFTLKFRPFWEEVTDTFFATLNKHFVILVFIPAKSKGNTDTEQETKLQLVWPYKQ